MMPTISQDAQPGDRASEKKAWNAPVLRVLDVSETRTNTSIPGSNDGSVDCS